MQEANIIFELLKQTGLAGVAVIAFWLMIKKDRQVSALYERLAEKGEANAKKYAELSSELNDTLSALTDSLKDGGG